MFIYSDERREEEYMFLVKPCVFVDVGVELPNLYIVVIVFRFSAWSRRPRAALLCSHALYSQT